MNEIHAHFLTTKYPSLSLYLDTSGNGGYESGEKVWSTTQNSVLDVVRSDLATSYASGMKITIDAKVGTNKPIIAEFEAYLRYDSDGDGLTNQQETGTVYFYQSAAVGLPIAVPDRGSNNSTLIVNRLAGLPFRGLADFTVDHAVKEDVSAILSYWDGSAWIELPAWDPGKWLSRPTITYPAANARLNGVVQVTATVEQPALTTNVSFYLDGAWKASPAPSGKTYLWNWTTSGAAEGLHALMATTVDVWGATSSHSISVYRDTTAPSASIQSSSQNVCNGESVTITGSASDAGGLDSVTFIGTTYDKNGETTWSGSGNSGPLYPFGHFTPRTYRFSISATDLAGMSASAYVNVVASYCPESPTGGAQPASTESPIPGSSPGAGYYISPSSATVTAGIGRSPTEAGYTLTGTRHRIVVNLTNPTASMTSAERTARIAAPGLSGNTLNANQVWRLTVKDWVSGIAGSIIGFSVRVEEKTSAGNADTDADGLRDGEEALRLGSSPIAADTDVDGLADGYEVTGYSLTLWQEGTSTIHTGIKTNVTKWDTDGDGLSDGQERGFVTTGQSKVIGEVGRVTGVTGVCSGSGVMRVYLRNRYSAAVVIAQPPTRADSFVGVVRVMAVTDHTFDICFQEWLGDSAHGAEAVDYLVVEAGNHVFPDSALVEAGTFTASGSYAAVAFHESFVATPLILAQTQGYENTGTLVSRVKDVTALGFSAHVRAPSGTPVAETVGYVAVSPPANPSVLAAWTRVAVSASAGSTSGTIAFPAAFSATPRFLAGFATENAAADIGLRLSSLTNTTAGYVRDATGTTSTETIHSFAFAQSMNLTARRTSDPRSADTDADGLSDGTEVNAYGANPTLKDTDADGIADKVEVTSRTTTIPINGTSKSISFTTSPTSDDTDADGIKDSDELNGILDHRLLFYDMSTTTDATHLRDMSGNGNAGTMTETSSGTVKVGGARYFDGSNDKVVATIPGVSKLSAWSFCLWTKWDNGVATSFQHPIGFGTAHDVTVYWNKAALSLNLKATDASGLVVLDTSLGTFTSTTANEPHYLAVTYDGTTLRAYLDGTAKGPWSTTNVRIRSDSLKIGTSGSETGNFFNGKVDEVQVWDRTLAASEVTGYYNLTNAGGFVTWLDMETRDTGNNLLDFGGTSHPGIATGTTVVGGRSGFARKFAGGTDGIYLNGTATTAVSFTSGVVLSAYLLLFSYPAVDAPVVARQGDFYLNLTSDGRVSWSVYRKCSIVSPLPLPLNRWVRVAATANSVGASILLDGVQVASTSTTSAPLSASTYVTIGWAEGVTARFIGSVDEVLVLNAVPASANTLPNLGVRGILLNPNGTDTDGDGLADGQELFVKTFRVDKRYPIPDYSGIPGIATTSSLPAPISAPASFLASATAMVGITHTYMGDLIVEMHHVVGGTDVKYVVRNRIGGSTDNNFTSYDMLNTPLNRDRSDFVKPDPWYLLVSDNAYIDKGQIEYLQFQLTIHTLPNRADTDGDGLNDSEELNLGTDGFQTDPWKADTDGDGVADNEYFTKGTDPTRPDTDRDGINDNSDRVPLADAFIRIRVDSIIPVGTDVNDGGATLEPFVSITVGSETAYTSWVPVASGATATFFHSYSVNVDDSQPVVSITIKAWDYDTRKDANGNPYDVHTPIKVARDTSFGGCSGVDEWRFNYPIGSPGTSLTTSSSGSCPGTPYIYASSITVSVFTEAPVRHGVRLLSPLDYAGIYNVTNSSGATVGRRYIGEPRFVAVLANVTDTTFGGSSNELVVHLIPRSLFFDTKLYSILSDSSKSQSDPVVSGATVSFNGTSSATSDVLHSVVTVDVRVTSQSDGLAGLEGLLKANVTGSIAFRLLEVTGDLLLLNLPDEAVRLVAYTVPASTPSKTYRFCPTTTPNCGASQTSLSLWDQLWAGAVAVISQSLQYVASAIIATYNLIVQVANVIAQFGAWLWNSIQGAAQAVASAVQAAATVLGQVVSTASRWIIARIESQIQAMLSLLRVLLGGQADSATMYAQANQQMLHADNADVMSGLLEVVYSGNAFNLAVAFLVFVEGVWITLKAASFGIAEVASDALETVSKYITAGLVGLAAGLAFDAGMLILDDFFHSLIPSTDRFWSEGAGLALGTAVLATTRFVANFVLNPVFSLSKAGWVAMAIGSMALQVAAAWFAPGNFVGELLSAISLIIDIVALGEIVFKVDRPLDLIAAPFSLLDTGIALVTLGYDTAGLLKETRFT